MSFIKYYRADLFHVIHTKSQGVEYPAHNHISNYTILFVLNGTAHLTCENGAVRIDDFYVIAPYELHSLKTGPDVEIVTVCIDKSTFDTHNRELLAGILEAAGRAVGIDLKERLSAAFEYLFATQPFSAKNNGALADSVMLLEQMPEINLNISRLAQQAHFSDGYFIKLFKKEIGMTPHKFQIQNRIRKAQRLIEHDGLITDTAFQTGFCDQSHFIRNFKRHLGMTPRQYQKASQYISKEQV